MAEDYRFQTGTIKLALAQRFETIEERLRFVWETL